MANKTLEETIDAWFYERAANFKFGGADNYMGIEAKLNLARAKKKYEEDLAFHNLFPSSRHTALTVKRAKENLDYWQKSYDAWHGNKTPLLDEIKRVSSLSVEGGYVDIKKPTRQQTIVERAWCMCSFFEDFISFFKDNDLNIISTESENDQYSLAGNVKKRIGSVRILDGDDIYEVAWSGHCRKLSDEEMESIREEKRNKERIVAEESMARDREQSKIDVPDEDELMVGGLFLLLVSIVAVTYWLLLR